ncbi:MAG: hypothetical protein M1818_003890 [Claussenomyces sp. TS43310]|nr:MAG: hypothetical protein M1818_003890 [Claussenomyces sp. TS43310]
MACISTGHLGTYASSRKDKTLETILATLNAIDKKLDQKQFYRYGPSAHEEAAQAASGYLQNWEELEAPSENWLVQITEDFNNPLPIDDRVDILLEDHGFSTSGRSMYLADDTIQDLCSAYFCSLHCTYPILDRDNFYSDLLPRACKHSFDENDEASALVLLVFALGSMAQEGTVGQPLVEESSDRKSGLKGGTIQRSPGSLYFNEAKRRMGLLLARYNIVILQCHVLAAGPTNELGLNRTGITELQDSVPLPLFLSESTGRIKTEEELFVEYHFLAQITMRTLLNRISDSLQWYRSPLHDETAFDQGKNALIQELLSQLHNWRTHLPAAISWTDDTELGASTEEIHPKWVSLTFHGTTRGINMPSILSRGQPSTKHYTLLDRSLAKTYMNARQQFKCAISDEIEKYQLIFLGLLDLAINLANVSRLETNPSSSL